VKCEKRFAKRLPAKRFEKKLRLLIVLPEIVLLIKALRKTIVGKTI
jgi:hypothetical protein